MRLLIFINSLGGGGAERVSSNLANYWAANGWSITLVTLSSQRGDFYELNPAIKRIGLELGNDSCNLFIGLLQNFRRIIAVRRVLRQVKPDIALSMMTTANILLAIAAYGLKKIRTVGSERTYPPQYPLGALWERLRSYSYGGLDVVVAQTSEGAKWIKMNSSAKRVVVIPNPVHWPMSNQLPHLNVEYVCRAGRKLLLAVGRLSSEKQFGMLVDCFQSLATRHPDWDLIVLGEGPLLSSLEAQVLAAGLEERIFFPGRVGNMGEWYLRADLFVLSSLFEGFPNALIESMAYGIPAVSFDCDTGPRDIIRHEVNGLLVPPGNALGLTAALDQLMGDDLLREKLSERAQDVREMFAMEVVAKKWENIFDDLDV